MLDTSMEDLKLKFDGQTHQIAANTLINSLLHFTNIVQEVNKDLGTGGQVEVKVNALPEGSFLCHITVQSIIDAAQNIFTKENMAVAKKIMEVVKGAYQLVKFLKGKKPKEVNSVGQQTTITNQNGDTIILNNPIFNIYTNNRSIREALAQEFETLDNDPNVSGFELLDEKDNPLVQIDRSEFSDIAASEDTSEEKLDRVDTKKVMLNIVRLSFEKNNKWDFYYDGNKISARINDEDFVKLIDNGEAFSKGDVLEAELEIRQEFEQSVNAYINKGYKILRIIRHIPRSEQGRLSFPKK